MRALAVILLCLQLIGCATHVGPITGKKYNILSTNDALAYLQETRQDYVNKNPNTSPKVKEAILSGQLIIGMTWSEVIATIGDPQEITSTQNAKGIYYRWIYYVLDVSSPGGRRLSLILYFNDNLLETIQRV